MCSKTGDNNLSAIELCPLVIVLYMTIKLHQLLCRLLSCEPYRLIESAVAGHFQKSHNDVRTGAILRRKEVLEPYGRRTISKNRSP